MRTSALRTEPAGPITFALGDPGQAGGGVLVLAPGAAPVADGGLHSRHLRPKWMVLVPRT